MTCHWLKSFGSEKLAAVFKLNYLFITFFNFNAVSAGLFYSISFYNIKISFISIGPKEIYLPKKLARDTKAREEFAKVKEKGLVLTEKYMIDIIREGWKNDDERLQRVVFG